MTSHLGLRHKLIRSVLRRDFPSLVFALALFIAMCAVEPRVLSNLGLNLTFLGIVPLVFATVAQMIIMVGGDIDLSIGSALGLVNVICAEEIHKNVFVGVLELLLFVIGYVAMGALIEWRRLPSLIVTFAFGFVWLGFALVILPTPGGEVPPWMLSMFTVSIPGVPEPILLIVVLVILASIFMLVSRPGRLIRALGSHRLAAEQFARRPQNVRLYMYAASAVVIVVGGLALSAQNGSGDPNSGQSYILLSVAAVIIGGGEFSGGTSWPVGAVLGAIALGLLSAIDSFVNIPSNYVVGLQGLLLLVALALRRVMGIVEARYEAGQPPEIGDGARPRSEVRDEKPQSSVGRTAWV